MFIQSAFIRKNSPYLQEKLKEMGYKTDSIPVNTGCIATSWNPQVYQRELIVGDYVAFQMPQSNILRVGIVIEAPRGKITPSIKCLTDNKIYYPYSQNILLFNDNCVMNILTAKIVEVE